MISSLNTNSAAFVALATLRQASTEVDAATKRLSTGYKVADALDDGAVFGIAQAVRTGVAATAAANRELGNASRIVQVASAVATDFSNGLNRIREILTALSDPFLSASSAQQYAVQYSSIVERLGNMIASAAPAGDINLVSCGSVLSITRDGLGNRLEFNGSDFDFYRVWQAFTGGSGGSGTTDWFSTFIPVGFSNFNASLLKVTLVIPASVSGAHTLTLNANLVYQYQNLGAINFKAFDGVETWGIISQLN